MSKEFKSDDPMIIAMQGEPYTGKTTLANSLAKHLKCLVIRLDEILHVISSHEPRPPTPERAETLMSNTFEIITQIVKTHASFGNSVVIDSPLSRHSHLNQLVDLILQLRHGKHRLVLIQCQPQTEYAWQMRYEERDLTLNQNKWYKPQDKTWPLDPVFSRDYTDDEIHPIVSKLVVDTTDHVPLPSLFNALIDLMMLPEGETSELEEWIRLGEPAYGFDLDGIRASEGHFGYCRKGHWFRACFDAKIGYSTTCLACDGEIDFDYTFYTCYNCPLTIHKECGELDKIEFTPTNFPKLLSQDGSYCFPEEHFCKSCKDEWKEFSYECESCAFQCHLKCKLIPTIVTHPGHEHRLSFRLTKLESYEYLCSACKRPGKNVGYHCIENCKADYHPECALLPRVFREHEHSGHKHDLEMVFDRGEELEDYICGMCLEKMNPKAWYYYCHDCYLTLHLDCAFKDFDG